MLHTYINELYIGDQTTTIIMLLITSDSTLHPNNIVYYCLKSSKIPTAIIAKICQFLQITERLWNIPKQFEKTWSRNIMDCRDHLTKLAITYPSYYEKFPIIYSTTIKTRLVNWIQKYTPDERSILEFSTENKRFKTTIGIINESDDDDEDFARPIDFINERYIYARFTFFEKTIVYMGKKRRLQFLRLLKTFQHNYGFHIDQELVHIDNETICLSKIYNMYSTDLLDPFIVQKARHVSMNSCLNLLIDVHDEICKTLL